MSTNNNRLIQAKLLVFPYLFISAFLLFSNSLNGQSIEKIEPPFWYAGMNNPELQLLVYGKNIQSLYPHIQYDGVKVKQVHLVDNPNYLFIDLHIDGIAKPGTFEIKFQSNKKTILTQNYDLRKRKDNMANRSSFSTKDVIYLITPDRFANSDPTNDEVDSMKEKLNRSAELGRHGGDIQGIIDHLDYIKEMGFTAVWLNPILENNQADTSYHGYSTTDYYKVDPRFGTNEDYINLSQIAADKGLGLIMDIIVNHCGSGHWWMNDLPSDDWVNNQNLPYQQTNHRKSTLLDPYASPSDRKIMTEGWFVPTMPDLNQRNPLMSKYLIQNSIWWIEYANLYGIRQDTYSYPFREFMTEWTCAIMDEYPNFKIVGEEWVDDPAIIAYWQQGKNNPDGNNSCLTSIMDFPMNMALPKSLTEKEEWGKGFVRLYETLGQDFHYANPMELVIFPDNHDMSRIFTQVNEDYDLYKMALTYILTMRGIPQLYYGTEILMHNRSSGSHGIIRSDFPGGWAGDAINAVTKKGLTPQQIDAQNWVKAMLHWRQDKTVIHAGKLMHYDPRNGIYVYFRYDDNETVMVVLNKNMEATSLELERFESNIGDNKFATDVISNKKQQLGESITIPPRSASVFELTK